MGGLKKVAAFVAVLLAAQVTMLATGSVILVGGKTGWKPDKNYTEWSSQQKFYVYDWLMFWVGNEGYERDVLEVNEASYLSCNSQDFIKNVTVHTRRNVFQLTEPKTYYFICGKGYCSSGMKLAVAALPYPDALPSPDASNSVSKNTLIKPIIFIATLCFILV